MKHILESFEEYKIKSGKWFKDRAHGAHAKAWLAALSFSEASFFVIPPDILLVAILMVGSSRWVYYAGLTTIVSILGGAFGYVIGFFFFDTVGVGMIELYNLTEEFLEVQELYSDNAFLVIFAAAFTPIPYKIFVLSAGFLKINFIIFLIASIIGRGLRYFLIAYITKTFGGEMTRLFLRYFNIITVLAVLLLGAFLFFSLLL